MNKNNKKGFTLVELIAVVVILIIILVLAINKVRSTSLEARKKAVRANAISYIKNLKQEVAKDLVDSTFFDTGYFTVDDFKNKGIKVSGTMPDNGYILLSDYNVNKYCLVYGDYEITDIDNEKTIKEGNCSKHIKDFDTYFYDNVISSLDNYEIKYVDPEVQPFIVPYTGKYVIQLWGASGQDYNSENPGGKGAYTAGIVTLNKGQILYFNIGGKGVVRTGGYNGGANGGSQSDGTYYAGGGATDVRLVYGDWNLFLSLKSRIMVAAGGAGAGYYNGGIVGGAGGALVGLSGTQSGSGSTHSVATGGSQTDPGKSVNGNNSNSGFGYSSQPNTYGTGGGGGYYGGGSGGSTSYKVSAGAGGSSFISGHKGCDAIDESSESSAIVHTHQNKHYSNIVFTNTVMKSGNEEMPTHDNTGKMTGNTGNGYALISLIISYDDSNSGAIEQTPNKAYFSFTGSEQTFTISKTGTYKLEVWGAQGGGSLAGDVSEEPAGYGAYSAGIVNLNKDDVLYIYVGGKGTNASKGLNVAGGYNGGGSGTWDNNDDEAAGGGGGATHIALRSGLLSTLEEYKDDILIVAGGGGGKSWRSGGGSGGGYIGGPAGGGVSATQSTGYQFGQGQNATGTGDSDGHGGGGGGYWGGYESTVSSESGDFGGGGSGYIGNSILSSKAMYCYQCSESNDEDTKTISVTCADENPNANCAKKGNGYAKITFVE